MLAVPAKLRPCAQERATGGLVIPAQAEIHFDLALLL
jgi:hypothetical protein